MPSFNVQRSTLIQADAQTVFDAVANFQTWTTWSPWLSADKEAAVTVTENSSSVGAIYRWKGDVVGHGEIEHTAVNRPTSIDDHLRFVKPFKSEARVRFDLKPANVGSEASGTEIIWSMDSSLPWFMFWMKPSMVAYIGMDYARGLKMLKEYIETGSVASAIDVAGVEPVAARTVIGASGSSDLDRIGKAMEPFFQRVNAEVDSSAISSKGEMISLYHPSSDIKQGRFDFTCGHVVDASTQVPKGLVQKELPAGKTFRIRHTGSYENLGNAWSAAYQIARYKKLKLAKADSYEIYRNNPADTAAADLVTDIYLPLR